MKVKSEREGAQSCPTLSDPIDWSLPGSSVHGIFHVHMCVCAHHSSHTPRVSSNEVTGLWLCPPRSTWPTAKEGDSRSQELGSGEREAGEGKPICRYGCCQALQETPVHHVGKWTANLIQGIFPMQESTWVSCTAGRFFTL